MIALFNRSFKTVFTAALTAAAIASSGAALAATKIVAMKIDGLYQKDGKGLYDQIVAAAAKQSGQGIEIQVVAPNRALKDFESGKYACVSPANTNPDFYDFKFSTVESKSMTTAKIYIFTKAGSQPITDLASLKGKKVGICKGLPYGAKVEGAGLKLIKAGSDEANVKKLMAGRIDAFLAYTPDMYTVFRAMGIKPLAHDANKPVAVHEDTILCRKDKGGDAIVAAFNKGFQGIEKSGELAKILGE